jgi:SAM-dependent methyltransferase
MPRTMTEPEGMRLPAAGEPPFACLGRWLTAPVTLALLELAIDLELPDVLARAGGPQGRADLAAVARALGGARQEALGPVLDAMAAAGLLEKREGRYANAALADAFLRKDRPAYLGAMVQSLKAMQHRNLASLRELLFAPRPAVAGAPGLRSEEHWRRSARGLAGYQKAGIAEAMAALVAALPGAPGFRRMLDLGCGPAVTSLRMLERLPGLHLTLCDFAPVLDVAREEAGAAGLAGRVRFVPGDYNAVDFGADYDLAWACQSLYYARDLPAFLGRVFAALRPGGLFVSIHEGVHAEGTAPAELVLSRLSLALEGQDVSFARGGIAAAARGAGFVRVHAAALPMLYGEADLEIFRRPEAGDAGGAGKDREVRP